jgi:ABC-2 type transport system ATP-binding protein
MGPFPNRRWPQWSRSSPERPGEVRLSALVTRGLTKRYGSLAAVNHLDLSVDRGVLYGFLGPNGSGKTTTIRMVLGLIFPTEGQTEVLGQPLFGAEGRDIAGAASIHDALRRVGAIVEEPAFWRYLSGRRNLEYFARAAGPADDRRARLARIDQTLKLVGLQDAAGMRVKAYSQGMRQRLGIAQALLGAPELLVLDEPTNGLDPQGMREVRVLLRRLADSGTTVFVSSHLLAEVEAMCDRVGVLARGRLLADGPPSALRRDTEHLTIEVDDRARAARVLASFAGATIEANEGPGSSSADGGPGTLRVRLAPPATAAGVNARLVSEGVAVGSLVPERDTLEDVFVALVEKAERVDAEG